MTFSARSTASSISVEELDLLTGAGLQPPAIGTGHQADNGVLRAGLLGQPARLPGDRKHHLEVLVLLRSPRHR